MKYLCLVCADGDITATMSKEDWAVMDIDSQAYDRQLQEAGSYIAAEALQSPDTAVTVRVRDGRMSTTDGPYIETKEQVAGFILIEARDLNDAIRIAAGIPMGRVGCVEVRPIMVWN